MVRLTLVLVTVLVFAPSAYAQRFVEKEVSGGGQFAVSPESHVAGWYVDAMKSFAPALSIVGEASGHYSVVTGPTGHEQWIGILGGIRRRLVTPQGANVFAQFLVGGWHDSISDGRYNYGFGMLALQPGIGVEIPVDSRWSIHARGDLRMGAGDDSVTGAFMVGGGVTRFWGQR